MSPIQFQTEEAIRDFQRATLTLIRKAFDNSTVELNENETFALCWFLDALMDTLPE